MPPLLLGADPLIEHVRSLILKVAPTEATVLITGESGTGKEVVARLIHSGSKRAGGPFVAVNCGAIANDLLESEMFGHERGSFTGADTSRAGLFQFARGGTIFLDEIAEMSPLLQVKLLRVLQEREVRAVGSERTVKVDVRVVAATNKDLGREILARRFREDLYYRLNVIPMVLPPLRDWRRAIPQLVEHFRTLHNQRHRKDVRISDEAMVELGAYDWPGNVRQLENTVERVVVLSESGIVHPTDLPARLQALVSRSTTADPVFGESGVDLCALVDGFEGNLIDKALGRSGGDLQAAARLLGVNHTILVGKLARRSVRAVPTEVAC